MLFNSHIFIFVFLPLLLAGWYFLNYKRPEVEEVEAFIKSRA